MSLHLQRIRLSIRTKDQWLAGTNSSVRLRYVIDEDHNHPSIEPGEYSLSLDHPFHDDLQRGAIDSYEADLAQGSSGRELGGTAVPNGIVLRGVDHARSMLFHLTIEGSDRWIFDRYLLAGYFKEMRELPGDPGKYELVDLGWLEMAKHTGEVSMSTNPAEGVADYRIELDGSFGA